MADYWIKLYHEIIDDPKMATLPDRLWRRVIELFLLAGRLCPDKSGKLPDTRQLAWLLRMPTDDLQTDLTQLAVTGIIQPIPGGWLIKNFEKRQQAASSTERSRQSRSRAQKQQYYDNATTVQRFVAQINRAETETEAEAEKPPQRLDAFRVYSSEFGAITPKLSEAVKAAIEDYTEEWVVDAMHEAVLNNVRNWKYVEAILRRWKKDGRIDKKRDQQQAQQPAHAYAEEW